MIKMNLGTDLFSPNLDKICVYTGGFKESEMAAVFILRSHSSDAAPQIERNNQNHKR